MKLHYVLVPLAVAGSASATIVNANNFSDGGPSTLPILDNTGTLLSSGFVAVGSFAPAVDFGDIQNLFAPGNFRQFASDLPFETDGFTANGGIFNGRVFNEPSSTTDDLTATGLPVFVVIGDGTTISDSLAFAVWESSATFTADDTDTNIEGSSIASVRSGLGTLRVGGEVTDVTVTLNGSTDLTYANGIQMAAIPEPSTSLLAALAGLGLIARRRR